MAKLYLKWTVLVWLNAIVGLILGGSGVNVAHDIGIFLGVCVFIPLYALLDNYALKTGNVNLQQSLLIGVILRACLQMIVVVDLVAGILASAIVGWVFGLDVVGLEAYDNVLSESGFWYGFLMTITTGAILSGVVGVLTMGVMLLVRFLGKGDNRANQPPQN